MSLETRLFAALKTIPSIARTGGFYAIWPVEFPEPARYSPQWPAIRYTFVDSVPVQDLVGDGDDDTADVRVQIDVVDTTYSGVRLLRLQVMDVMRNFLPPSTLQLSTDEKDSATDTYRCILDYLVNPSSGSGSP